METELDYTKILIYGIAIILFIGLLYMTFFYGGSSEEVSEEEKNEDVLREEIIQGLENIDQKLEKVEETVK